ncbi:hypothetical protein BH24ACI3_BH24ACI3_06690 [soil metagenome]
MLLSAERFTSMPACFFQLELRLLRAIGMVFCLFALVLSIAFVAAGQDDGEDNSGEAIRLFAEGPDAHEKGEFGRAVEFYRAALKVVPEFAEAELQRCSALLSLGKRDDAEMAFRRAVELREDWTLGLAALGSVLVEKGAFDEADTVLAKAIKLDELNFPAYASLTELRLRTKANTETLRELLSAVVGLTSKAKSPAAIWAARAALEHSLGDAKSARASVERGLAIDPKNISALSEAAQIALTEKDPTGADGFAARLASAGGSPTNIRMLQARIAIAKDLPDEALEHLNAIEPATKESLELIAKIKDATIADPAELEQRLAAAPGDALILGRLCSAYRISAPAKALAFCQQASQAEPNNIEHAIGFGAALIQARRFDDAISLLTKLVGQVPENSTARANLATALFQAKRYEDAKKEFRWLLDRQPTLTVAYYFLAVSHDNLQEYMDAMANYQEYLRRADAAKDKDEIDRVTLRMPILERQIRSRKGKKR